MLFPKEFTYGYAITCHKAQGSEWDKVLVIEENFPFAKVDHARWLYTAATRAAEKISNCYKGVIMNIVSIDFDIIMAIDI